MFGFFLREFGSRPRTTHEPRRLVIGPSSVLCRFECAQPNSSLPAQTWFQLATWKWTPKREQNQNQNIYMFMCVNLQKWVVDFTDPTTPMPLSDASISLLRFGHVRVIKKKGEENISCGKCLWKCLKKRMIQRRVMAKWWRGVEGFM